MLNFRDYLLGHAVKEVLVSDHGLQHVSIYTYMLVYIRSKCEFYQRLHVNKTSEHMVFNLLRVAGIGGGEFPAMDQFEFG